MSASPSPEAMSSRSSHRSAASRGSKRSITTLNNAQLAKKRANDRETQRNIRQRTKQHIENLEKKIKELEGRNWSSSMERALQRNQELESEIERLRSQLSTPSKTTSDFVEDIYPQPNNELNWILGSPLSWRNVQAHIPVSNADVHSLIGTMQSAYAIEGYVHPSTPTSIGYFQAPYAEHPIWNDPCIVGNGQPLTLTLSK